MQGRTSIILLSLAFFCVFLFSRSNAKFIYLLLLIPVFILNEMIFNGIQDLQIFNRFSSEGLDSPRFKLWAQGVSEITTSSFHDSLGGNNADTLSHSAFHNVFLDLWNSSGVFTLILLLITLLASMVQLLNIFYARRQIGLTNVKMLMFGFFGFFASVFGEPIQDASIYFYSYMFVIFGIISGLSMLVVRRSNQI